MGHLALADAFIITADSVSMLSEACSTGYVSSLMLAWFNLIKFFSKFPSDELCFDNLVLFTSANLFM